MTSCKLKTIKVIHGEEREWTLIRGREDYSMQMPNHIYWVWYYDQLPGASPFTVLPKGFWAAHIGKPGVLGNPCTPLVQQHSSVTDRR